MLHQLPSSPCPHRTVVLVMLFHLDSNGRKRKRKRKRKPLLPSHAGPPDRLQLTAPPRNPLQKSPDIPRVCAHSALPLGGRRHRSQGLVCEETAMWLRPLARHRASIAPPAAGPAIQSAGVVCWSGLLAFAARLLRACSTSCRPGFATSARMSPNRARFSPTCSGKPTCSPAGRSHGSR